MGETSRRRRGLGVRIFTSASHNSLTREVSKLFYHGLRAGSARRRGDTTKGGNRQRDWREPDKKDMEGGVPRNSDGDAFWKGAQRMDSLHCTIRMPRERWQDGIRMVQCVNLPSLGTFSVVNVGRPDGIRFAVRQLHAVARPFVRSWGGLARRRYPMFEPSALFCTTYGLVPKARASEPLLAVPHTAPTVMLNMQARVSLFRAG